jgi:hypothetical protein
MDDDEKPPLRVVSDNPNALGERAARQAKARAEKALARAAASLLRVMAGGDPASYDILDDMIKAVLAEQKLEEITGRGLSFSDVQDVLQLPHAELDAEASDSRYREWQRERGMDLIVQGALRLAAHQLLDERPHFGGKYSERLIEDGMRSVKTAFDPPPKPRTKKQLAADKKAARISADDLMKERAAAPDPQKAPTRKKRWSPLDSRSYLDPKPED